MNKIALVTGARAEYWLLRPLILKFQNLPSFKLFVTGEHLLGPGLEKIKADNLDIAERIECLSENDSYLAMAQAISRGINNFARVFAKYEPNIIILLGDRYEIFAAASAAYSLKIPIAHVHGGEVTHGALDDGFRHTISKMSALHFVSHDTYRSRLIKMGENPLNVHTVGAIGLDNIFKFEPNKDCIFFNKYPLLKANKYFLLTLHSSTLSGESTETQASEVIKALNMFSDYRIVITQSNRDPDGILLNKKWVEWEEKSKNIIFVPILGDDYLHAAYYSQLVIGNSSSGVLEIPYLDRPVINIGTRQNGRIFPKGVFCTDFNTTNIVNAINCALNNYASSEKVYGIPGHVSESIYNIVSNVSTQPLIYKKFYDAK